MEEIRAPTPLLENRDRWKLKNRRVRKVIMRADRTMILDGVLYKPGDEIWDLGSFVAVQANGMTRSYEGLSIDAPEKLPHYVNAGSSALCLDTGDMWKYHEKSAKWYKIRDFMKLSEKNAQNFQKHVDWCEGILTIKMKPEITYILTEQKVRIELENIEKDQKFYFEFNSGEPLRTIILPQNVKSDLVIEPNKNYKCVIKNNVLIWESESI